jgi:TonB family protein
MNGATPVPPQAVRIDVTFARIRGMKIEQLLKRTLYVTVGHAEGSAGANEGVPSGRPVNKAGARNAFIALDDGVPAGRGIKEEALFESDLLTGSPVIGGTHTYWQEISRRITHRWSERNRSVRGEKATMPPRVRFRLYPDGAAQTIYIERSSENQRVDDAGLESVVNTQPFQPFPAGLTDPYVDVHVDFSPGAAKR